MPVFLPAPAVTFGSMQITKFLPTPQKMSQETIATLAAIIISAWLVSRIPALKKLVQESNTQPY